MSGHPWAVDPELLAQLEAWALDEEKAARGVQGPSFVGTEWGADIIERHRERAALLRRVLSVIATKAQL